MGDSLSALSIICGILAALYISYESQIESIIDQGIPDYPENSSGQYEELTKILKHCIRPLLISSLTMVITLLPETIKVLITTITFFVEKEWSLSIFNPKYYSFASIMVIVIHFLFIFLLYKTVKWNKELLN
ncbi:hypothetical protein CN514_22075, partial [Bacillus sp. AFS001701]|uniref:hypothetical protein n=1 Tax=Bacillus sp. AFS001701 TaxID=2033480 RepID=UPI000BFAE257